MGGAAGEQHCVSSSQPEGRQTELLLLLLLQLLLLLLLRFLLLVMVVSHVAHGHTQLGHSLASRPAAVAVCLQFREGADRQLKGINASCFFVKFLTTYTKSAVAL